MSENLNAPNSGMPQRDAIIPTPDDRPEKMLDEASHHCRNILYLFVLFLFYAYITVEAVTDRDLLIAENVVKLPLLDIGMPLLGFFIAAPGLIILLHLNLMMELELHARKLAVWNKAILRYDPTSRTQTLRLFPFIFNYSGYNAASARMRLPGLITWIMVYAAPLFVLTRGAMKFVPYHSYEITAWHCIAIWLDFVVILTYWFRIRRPRAVEDAWANKSSQRSLVRKTWRTVTGHMAGLRLRINEIGAWHLTFASVPAFLLLTVLTFNVIAIPETNRETLVFTSLPISDIYHRNLDLRGQTLVKAPPPDAILASYETRGITPDSAWMKYTVGLNLNLRDLRFANLAGCQLWKADLRGARMDYCELSGTQLSRAILSPFYGDSTSITTQLLGSYGTRTIFNGAILDSTRFNNTSLTNAQFNDASLKYAQFNEAELYKGQFNGASLDSTQFNSASLSKVQFNDTWLHDVQFNDAWLDDVQFDNDSLDGVQFNGASFYRAQFNGALLVGTRFNGASLDDAQFNGASLFSRTQFNGASLTNAQFNGALLTDAQFNCASLSYAQFNGALLTDAQFNCASLDDAQFNGASLISAEFNGASLIRAQSNGMNVSGSQLRGAVLPDVVRGLYWRYPYNTTSTIAWDSLLWHITRLDGIRGDLLMILDLTERLCIAEERYQQHYTPSSWRHLDPYGFIAARTTLADSSPTIALGMLCHIDTSNAVSIASTRAIITRLQIRHPETLEILHKRYPMLEEYLINVGLLKRDS